MKETVIRKKAIEQLTKEGFYCWFPKKAKFQETDVFGVYDILAVKGKLVRWVQITSLANISARKHKIEAFLRGAKASIPSEVWGIREDKTFKIIKL